MTSPDEKLRELGIELPAIAPFPRRMLNRPVTIHGDVGYVSGMGPIGVEGAITGALGSDLSVEEGYSAARMTAHRMMAVLRDQFSQLENIERWLSVRGFVRSAEGFEDQPAVMNGFTEAIVEVFGEDRGLCSRSAIGTSHLPLGIPIEVEAVVAVVPAIGTYVNRR